MITTFSLGVKKVRPIKVWYKKRLLKKKNLKTWNCFKKTKKFWSFESVKKAFFPSVKIILINWRNHTWMKKKDKISHRLSGTSKSWKMLSFAKNINKIPRRMFYNCIAPEYWMELLSNCSLNLMKIIVNQT